MNHYLILKNTHLVNVFFRLFDVVKDKYFTENITTI